ncbi:MAG: thioesterase family protein [Desulfatirhabdiaceae bacterium]
MKIQIDYPDKTVFTVETRLRITDLSPSGHLGFDNLVAIINDASARFFESRGIKRKQGHIGTIYTDLGVSYQSETFYGDVLTIEMAIGETYARGFDLMFRVNSQTTGKIVALAKIGILFFDYQIRQAVPIPDGVL